MFHKFLFLSLFLTLAFQQLTSQSAIITEIKKTDNIFKENPRVALQALDALYDSDKKMSPPDEAEILYAYSKYYTRLQQLDSSLYWGRRGYHFVQRFAIDSMIADFTNILGGVHLMSNKPDSAAYYFLIAAQNLKKHKEYVKSGYVYNNLANIFLDDKQFEKALEYLQQGEKILLEQNIEAPFTGTLYGNMSFVYFSLDSLDLAKKYADKAIETGLKQEDPTARLYGILTLADLAARKKDNISALSYYEEAYTLASQLQDDYKKALCTAAMASFFQTSSPKKSIQFGEEAEDYFKNQLPRFRVPNLLTLAKAYEKDGQTAKAMEKYKLYGQITDSLSKQDYQKLKLELLEKYEAVKKSEVIAQQKSELVAKSLLNTRLFSGLLFALVIILSLIYRSKMQKLKANQKLKSLQETKEQATMLAVVEGEQNERVRLAKDLHDGLANEIAALKMFTGLKNMDLNSPILNEIEQKLNLLHQNTRNTAHNMLPKTFVDEGLIASLQVLCNEYSAMVPVNFTNISYLSGKRKSFELFVYRIAQEIISNAVRYADAGKIDVKINDTGSMLTLSVSDDGKGISEDILSSGFGFVKSRLADLGGNMEVQSSSGSGTEVTINIRYGD